MTLADIIQIIISILTLIATIAVSCSIYWLQMRHEKESKRIELERKAEEFLFDNEDEREYLPLCVFANNLHRHKKHIRKIYTNFCRCSEEVQNEILKQAGFSIDIVNDSNWIYICFDLLNKDIEKYKLGRDILYDGAKYFHRGFEHHRKELWNRFFYREQFFSFISCNDVGQKKLISIQHYIEDYFDYILDRLSDTVIINEEPEPPIDYVWFSQNLSTVEEKYVCYWVMTLVDEIIKNIYNRFIYKIFDRNTRRRDNNVWESVTDAEIITFEDKYYEIVMWLYYAYYVK